MGTENLPVAHTQSSQDRLPLFSADFGICIHRGHQNRCVLVVFRLGCGEAVNVDVDIAGKGNMVLIINQNHFTRKMAAVSFVDFKMQITEIKETDLGQRSAKLRKILPGSDQLVGTHLFVGGKDLADIHIGSVQEIAFPEAVFALIFTAKALGRPAADDDFIKHIHETAMIHVRMGQQQTFVGCFKSGNAVLEDLQHFLSIAGITTVHTEKFPMAFDHRSITATGRLDQKDLGMIGDGMCGDSGNKLFTLGLSQKLCKLADTVKRPVGRQSLFIQNLHGQIGRHHKSLLLFFAELQHPGQAPYIGTVENAVVIGSLRAVVINDADFAKPFCLLDKFRDPSRILHIQTHFEILVIGAVFLGIDVGNVEVKIIDQLQNTSHASGNILKAELNKDDAGISRMIQQIADLFQFYVRFPDLFFCSFHIQKQHMAIHGFIVADPGDIDAQGSKTLTGLQKRPDMVWHGGGVCFFHRSIKPSLCPVGG